MIRFQQQLLKTYLRIFSLSIDTDKYTNGCMFKVCNFYCNSLCIYNSWKSTVEICEWCNSVPVDVEVYVNQAQFPKIMYKKLPVHMLACNEKNICSTEFNYDRSTCIKRKHENSVLADQWTKVLQPSKKPTQKSKFCGFKQHDFHVSMQQRKSIIMMSSAKWKWPTAT